MSSTRTFSLARLLTCTRTHPSINAIRASQLSIRSKLHTTGVLHNQAAYEEALAKSDNKRGKSRKLPNKVEATENTTKEAQSVENEVRFQWRPIRRLQTHDVPPPRITGLRGKLMDKDTFLKRIGRDCEKHADKFEDWDDLMTATTYVMKPRGIDIKSRKYIRSWVNKYSLGIDPTPLPFTKTEKLNMKK